LPREPGTARRRVAAAAAGGGDPERSAAALASAADMLERAGHPAQAALARLDLARAHLRRGAPAEALAAARDAARGLGRTGLASARRAARAVEAQCSLSTGDSAAARRLARAAARDAAAAGDDRCEVECLRVLAELDRESGRRASALARYRRAVELVEQARSRISVDEFKSSFLDDKVGLYEGAVALCLEGGTDDDVAEAFRTLELSKSRGLADLLAEYARERPAGGHPPGPARERFARLADELAWRRARNPSGRVPGDSGSRRGGAADARRVRGCERRLADAFRELQAAEPALAELHRAEPPTAEELRALLGAREALVEFATARGQVWAFVLTRRALRAFGPLCPAGRVDALLEGLGGQIEAFALGRDFAARQLRHLRRGVDAYLADLYDALLRPLEPAVGDRDLVVVPHGRLHGLPVHALLDGDAYLVERRGVSYAPSAAVYAACARRPRAASGPPLICGVPAEDAPGIDRELEAVRELFPDAHVLAGPAATRAAFATGARGRRIVHVATHARFRADNPLLSSLSLADGDLTFYDVFDMRFAADLVTLSGCDTGTTAVAAGDELHGLVRGFLYAGAPSLLLSLWPADDAATVELMRAFYGALAAGQSKRAALRGAQREALARHGHPYYWAPFALIGRTT
jgi:hypothetical protein